MSGIYGKSHWPVAITTERAYHTPRSLRTTKRDPTPPPNARWFVKLAAKAEACP